jgi:TolB protein
MTVTAPPRPPRPSDPLDREELEALVEALIEEARKRAQRRRRRNGAIVTFVALVGVALFAVLGRSAQSQTASPSLATRSSLPAAAASSKIAFISQPPGGGYCGSVHVMNTDGSGRHRLTPGGADACAQESDPAWSPDGQKIAIGGIYVMNADGSGQQRLARGNAPAWSPDGKKIAFLRSGENSEVYVMNADGGRQQRLARGNAPAWSPDGKKIAFLRSGEIYVMNADGGRQQRLARGNAPAWSPDGRRIAFRSTRDGNPEIYVMNADGSGQRRLTRAVVLEVTVKNENRAEGNYSIYVRTDESQGLWYTGLTHRSRAKAEKLAQTIRDRGARNFAPAWSPDGQRIAFERWLGRQQSGVCRARGYPLVLVPCFFALIFEVHVMNADGSGQQALTRRGAKPGWSPDGRKIAFVSERDGNAEIYVMNADGSGQRNLTRTPRHNESGLVWSPAQK